MPTVSMSYIYALLCLSMPAPDFLLYFVFYVYIYVRLKPHSFAMLVYEIKKVISCTQREKGDNNRALTRVYYNNKKL